MDYNSFTMCQIVLSLLWFIKYKTTLNSNYNDQNYNKEPIILVHLYYYIR